MDSRFWQYGLSLLPSVFAGLGLVLVVVNGVLGLANRSTQAEVATRAQYITQTVQLDRVLQALARAAATAALNNHDTGLDDLLTANGIRYEANTPAGAAAGAAPNAPAANAAVAAPAPPARANTSPAGATPGQPARAGR